MTVDANPADAPADAAAETRAEGDDQATGSVINYHFPIHVEVVGTLPDAEVRRVAGYVFDQLDQELTTRI